MAGPTEYEGSALRPHDACQQGIIRARASVPGDANGVASKLNSPWSILCANLILCCVAGQRRLRVMSACLVVAQLGHWKVFGEDGKSSFKMVFPCLYDPFCSGCAMIAGWNILDSGIVAGDEFLDLSGCFNVQFVKHWYMSRFC